MDQFRAIMVSIVMLRPIYPRVCERTVKQFRFEQAAIQVFSFFEALLICLLSISLCMKLLQMLHVQRVPDDTSNRMKLILVVLAALHLGL